MREPFGGVLVVEATLDVGLVAIAAAQASPRGGRSAVRRAQETPVIHGDPSKTLTINAL